MKKYISFIVFRLTLIAIVFSAILSLKAPRAERPMYPIDFDLTLIQAQKVEKLVNGTLNDSFKIAISGPLNFLNRSILMKDLKDKSFHKLLSNLPQSSKSLENDFFKTLGVKLDVDHLGSNCSIEMEITNGTQGTIRSLPVDCKNIVKNNSTAFDFQQGIFPGEYDVGFLAHDFGIDSNLSVFASTDSLGQRWLVPHVPPKKIAGWEAISSWLADSFTPALIYVFILIFLAVSIFFMRPGYGSILIFCFCLYFGNSLITKPFSGHDETAHITTFMLKHHENREVKGLPNLSQQEVYRSINIAMIESEFYRLNPVPVNGTGDCPHFFLKRCESNTRSRIYYGYLSSVFSATGLRGFNVYEFIEFAKLFNLLMMIGVASLFFLIAGKTGLVAFAIACILNGALLGQMASITNDTVIYFLGAICYLSICKNFFEQSARKKAFALCLSIAVCPFAVTIDHSGWSLIPAVFVSIIAIFLSRNFRMFPDNLFKRFQWTYLNYILIFCFFMVLTFTLWYFFKNFFARYLSAISPDLNFLGRNPQSLSVQLNCLFLHFKSLAGSFVWGHSYYQRWFNFIWLVIFISGWSYFIVFCGSNTRTRFGSLLLPASFGIFFGGYLIAITIVRLYFRGGGWDIETYSKPRFMPGLVWLMFIPSWHLSKICLSNYGIMKICHIVLGIYTLIVLGFFLPKFFLIDAL